MMTEREKELVAQLVDATGQVGVLAGLLREALPLVMMQETLRRLGPAGDADRGFALVTRIERALSGKMTSLDGDGELKGAPSKGTRATLIYKAMLAEVPEGEWM